MGGEEVYPEVNTPEDQQLMGDIVRATLRPVYIRDVAKKFADDMLDGQNYVAIHWRYNIGDWTRHCRKKPSIQCDIVQRIVSDVEFVAENIVNYVQTYNYLESKQMKHKNFMEGKFAAGYFEEEEETESARPNSIYIRLEFGFIRVRFGFGFGLGSVWELHVKISLNFLKILDFFVSVV